jgi:hypothetical protein
MTGVTYVGKGIITMCGTTFLIAAKYCNVFRPPIEGGFVFDRMEDAATNGYKPCGHSVGVINQEYACVRIADQKINNKTWIKYRLWSRNVRIKKN